jgi:hypothetical protein
MFVFPRGGLWCLPRVMRSLQLGSSSANPLAAALPSRSGITWMTKDGLQKPNYFGSLTQAATCRVGNYKGEEIHVPFSSLLPMVNPNDMVIGGWDISGERHDPLALPVLAGGRAASWWWRWCVKRMCLCAGGRGGGQP